MHTNALQKETKKFNMAKVPYALLATNSNTYVRTMLDKCDIPGGDARLPPGVTVPTVPGWSIVLLPSDLDSFVFNRNYILSLTMLIVLFHFLSVNPTCAEI